MSISRAILFLLLLSFPSFAQNDSAVYVRYDITNGLPSNNVYMCMQDHLGYMWFATEKGVVKYNGYEFKLFNTSNGLPNDDVWNMQEDEQGRIWLYSISHKFGYLDHDKYYDCGLPDMGRDLYPSEIYEEDGRTLFYFDGKDDVKLCKIEDSKTQVFDIEKFFDRHMPLMAIGRSGKGYSFNNDANNIYACDLFKNDAPKPVCDLRARSSLEFKSRLFNLNDRYFFAVSIVTNEIELFDLKACTERLIFPNELENNEKNYVTHRQKNGILVIYRRDFYIVDTNGSIQQRKINVNLLGNKQLTYYMKDAAGNEWFTTNGGGVYKVPPANAIIKKRPPATEIQLGQNTKEVFYWTASYNKLNVKNSDLTGVHISGQPPPLAVFNLDDSFKIVSLTTGIRLYDASAKVDLFDRFKKIVYVNYYSNKDSSQSLVVHDSLKASLFYNIKAIFRPSHNDIIFTTKWGMYKLTIYGDSAAIVRIDHERYSSVLFDKKLNRAIFIGREKVAIYDPESGKMAKIDCAKNFGGMVKSIQADHFHNFFMLTDNNLYLFNPLSNTYSIVHSNINLSGAGLAVGDSVLAVYGRFGIAMARIKGKNNVGEFSYLVNTGNLYYNDIGELYPSINENFVAETDKQHIEIQSKQLLKDGVQFKKRHFFTLINNVAARQTLHSNDTMVLAQDDNVIRLAVINLFPSKGIKINYTLAGRPWQSTSEEIFLDNSIKHGEYCVLRLLLEDDNLKSDPYIIYVYRTPRWYQSTIWTLAFWAGGILFFATLVFITIYFTRRYVAKANEKRQQLTDLELRAIHSQINPHFIFNTLSTALYFINRNEMEAAYEHVNKFSHLLRSYLKSSQERYISLDEEIEMLKKYIELQQSRFGEKFEFILTIDNKLPISHIMIPSLLLQPLVENAINHGLFHKKGKGILKIAFEQGAGNEELICTIEDNGVGRKAAEAINMSNEFKRESYGSKLTQGLIDIFEQYEQMNIDISYEDKQEPETGTVVKLVIRNIKYVTMANG